MSYVVKETALYCFFIIIIYFFGRLQHGPVQRLKVGVPGLVNTAGDPALLPFASFGADFNQFDLRPIS
jgi:hypothetical protein